MLGKCKGGVGEIAVVGVRTRARAALAMAEATSSVLSSPVKKIRKVSASTTTKYDVHELKRRRRTKVAPENTSSCWSEEDVVLVADTVANCSSIGEICSDFPASRCSSNDASDSREVVKDRLEIIADPEVRKILIGIFSEYVRILKTNFLNFGYCSLCDCLVNACRSVSCFY